MIPKKRLSEFCRYHIEGDCDCDVVLLRQYAKDNHLNTEQIWKLCYFFAITYNVPSAIVLFENRHKDLVNLRDTIIFQSDRKWVKFEDRFERLIDFYRRRMPTFEEFFKRNNKNGKLSLNSAFYDICKHWYYFKRFSTFLFLDTLISITQIKVEQDLKLTWQLGVTVTSGMLNLLGLDKQADKFDSSGLLAVETSILDTALRELQIEIIKRGGDPTISNVEGTLCGYRKHFKQSRYNGYYLDRMLEEIQKIKLNHPDVANKVLKLRSQCYPPAVLGECGGWKGIRKNLKKHYFITGEIHYDK